MAAVAIIITIVVAIVATGKYFNEMDIPHLDEVE